MDNTNATSGQDDMVPQPGAQSAESADEGSGLHVFDLAQELGRVQAAVGWHQSKHSAHTLLKASGLRLVLIVMHAGDRIAEHRAPGPISIHTLSGHLRVTAADRATDVPAGHVLTLGRDEAHAVAALADSAFLLTIAWPADAAAHG